MKQLITGDGDSRPVFVNKEVSANSNVALA